MSMNNNNIVTPLKNHRLQKAIRTALLAGALPGAALLLPLQAGAAGMPTLDVLRDLQSVASVEKNGPYSYGSPSCHSGQLDYYCLDRYALIPHRPNLHGTRTAIPGHPISH